MATATTPARYQVARPSELDLVIALRRFTASAERTGNAAECVLYDRGWIVKLEEYWERHACLNKPWRITDAGRAFLAGWETANPIQGCGELSAPHLPPMQPGNRPQMAVSLMLTIAAPPMRALVPARMFADLRAMPRWGWSLSTVMEVGF